MSRVRAAGSRDAHPEAKDMQDGLGFGGATVAKAVYKKPSQASGVLKRRPAALEKDSNLKKAKGGRQSWMRIKKIVASSPKRAYLTGSTVSLGKLRLIVEVSE